jgi:uncharacterized protein
MAGEAARENWLKMPSAAQFVAELLASDFFRKELLLLVQSLELPDCWIAAGFVRNAVWDHLHGREPTPPCGDVDVIWFDSVATDEVYDRKIESRLKMKRSDIDWSVKNQARMHHRNGDSPYESSVDAMRFWPETATAVAARLLADASIEIAAPLGLDDLLTLTIRPTTGFETRKRKLFEARVQSKAWLQRYPMLKLDQPPWPSIISAS